MEGYHCLDQQEYPKDYVCENCGRKVDGMDVCTCIKWCSICGKDYYDIDDALNCCTEKEGLYETH